VEESCSGYGEMNANYLVAADLVEVPAANTWEREAVQQTTKNDQDASATHQPEEEK